MSINEKIKAINNKIEQNKAQNDLDRQKSKISPLSSENISKYEFLTGKGVLPEKYLLEKAATMKRLEYFPLGKAFEKQTNVIKKQTKIMNKKEDKINKIVKTIIGTDEKYCDKVSNALLYLPKEHIEKHVEINKRMKPDDIVHRKHNVNTYGTIISFISNFSTEVADTDEMYKMLNKFNNEINELKSDYSAGEDKEIDAVIENASLVFNNQLKFFDDFLLKYKQRTPTKQISKRGSSSSPLSI